MLRRATLSFPIEDQMCHYEHAAVAAAAEKRSWGSHELSWELRCPKVPCSMLVLITVCLELWPRRTCDWDHNETEDNGLTPKLPFNESRVPRLLDSFSITKSLHFNKPSEQNTNSHFLEALGSRSWPEGFENLVHTYIKDVWSATASRGVLAVWLI